MAGLAFAALVLCLHITAGESQQLTIIVEHSQRNVTAGGDALFSVRPSGNVTSGSWTFNGKTVAQWIDQTGLVDNEYRSRAELFTSNGSLLLKSVNVLDSGEYRVNMVPTSGSQISATVTLRVTGESQQFTIIVEHSQINVTAGSEALFSVRPSSSVNSGSWSFNGKTVAQWIDRTGSLSNEYRSRAELFTSNGSLLLKSVNMSDSGEYRVNMVPASGSQTSATVTLRVTDPGPVTGVAVVTNNPTPLENLDTIALSCDASGTVQTRTWFKDNQPIRENGRIFTSPDKAKLTIISVNRNDAGMYKCIASNSFSSDAGQTYVEVYCKYTDGNCTLGSGAIVGILLGLLAMGLIGGVSGWLIARKTGWIRDPPRSQYVTSINSGRKGTLDTNTVNASGTYENLSRNEQGARNNAEDGNSTYMGLVLEDRSVYSDLKR